MVMFSTYCTNITGVSLPHNKLKFEKNTRSLWSSVFLKRPSTVEYVRKDRTILNIIETF